MKAVRFGCLLLAGALLGILPVAAQQAPPIAEAARRAREQKKQPAKAAKVWTNDNVSGKPGGEVGASAAAAAAPSAPAATAEAPAGAAAAGEEAEQSPEVKEKGKARTAAEEELKKEKAHLDRARRELELAQREFNLTREQYYSNPARTPEGPGQLDALTRQIAAKGEEIASTELKITQLTDQLENLNRELGPRKQAPPTSEQDRESWASRVRPLRQELDRVESEISRIRTEAAQRGLSVAGAGASGSFTAQQLQGLENRRTELQRKIAEIEDEARRAGVPVGWLR